MNIIIKSREILNKKNVNNHGQYQSENKKHFVSQQQNTTNQSIRLQQQNSTQLD